VFVPGSHFISDCSRLLSAWYDCARGGQGRAHERMNSFKSVALVNLRPSKPHRDAVPAPAPLEGYHDKSLGESRRVT